MYTFSVVDVHCPLSTYLVKWFAVETIAGRYIRPNPTPVMILETMSGKFA